LAGHADRDPPDPGPGVEPRPQRPQRPVARRRREPGESKRCDEQSAASVSHPRPGESPPGSLPQGESVRESLAQRPGVRTHCHVIVSSPSRGRRRMQVKCSKCSRYIALSAIIESDNGRCRTSNVRGPEAWHRKSVTCSSSTARITSSFDACPVASASASWSLPPICSVAGRTYALGAGRTSPQPFAHISSVARCCLPKYDSGRRR
jgi:hypothetical protein